MLPFLSEQYGNPSSLYKLGRQAHTAMAAARAAVAQWLGAAEQEIFFAPSQNVANHVAILGHMRAVEANSLGNKFICGPSDSPSIGHAADIVTAHGAEIELISIDKGWQNRCELARRQGAFVHIDAGLHLETVLRANEFSSLPLDSLCVSVCALVPSLSLAALVVRQGTAIMPILFGGGQEQGLFPGTEPVAAIVGFGKAAEVIASRAK